MLGCCSAGKYLLIELPDTRFVFDFSVGVEGTLRPGNAAVLAERTAKHLSHFHDWSVDGAVLWNGHPVLGP